MNYGDSSRSPIYTRCPEKKNVQRSALSDALQWGSFAHQGASVSQAVRLSSDPRGLRGAAHLREVCSRQDGLGVLQALDLILARILAHVEVLDDEVAVGVQLHEVLLDIGELGFQRRLLFLRRDDLRIQLGLG